MFGSEILEIAIGLIFVYVLFSMLVTLINEYIITCFSLRARNLGRIIEKLLDDHTGEMQLSKAFKDHPAIKYLCSKKQKYPSYIASEKFAKTVLDIIRTTGDASKIGNSSTLDTKTVSDAISDLDRGTDSQGNTVTYDSETLRLLKTFAKETSENIDAFGKKLESWFDETVERGQGWYNRKVKIITLIVGFVLVVGLNVDSISIYKTLSKSKDVRSEIIESAGVYLKENEGQSKPSESMEDAQAKLEDFFKENVSTNSNLLGLGWGDPNIPELFYGRERYFLPRSAFGIKLLGWIMTAFAISLGAPFWFDMLNKVMKLRSSIKQVSQSEKTQK